MRVPDRERRRRTSPATTAGRRRLSPEVLFVPAVLVVALGLAVWAAIDPGGVDWGAFSFVWAAALVIAAGAVYGLRVVSAQELALVAALAALATASRLLFASLPNVKPVTFIVLVSGAGLGPGPGFMVGATTALVSNFFFGQGPWTPWQMLAWGVVGIAGGLLSRGGRAPRRWQLVLAGSALALAFDWLLTFWMFVAFSAHTWPALVLLYAQGLPFDVAHVAATALFTAVFGVQAVAIIARFRARTYVTFLPYEGAS